MSKRTDDFHVGDRVVVMYWKYSSVPVGTEGTITNIYGCNIRVTVDGIVNKASQYGDFYFETQHLENITEGSTTIMTGNYIVAEVKFLEGSNTNRKYHYACYDRSITEGDICVVKSAHHGLGIAEVVGFIDTNEEITREIVCKCDFSEYNKRVENRKRMGELKDLMTARAKKLQDIALFQMLAKEDSEMASMLADYRQLTSSM